MQHAPRGALPYQQCAGSIYRVVYLPTGWWGGIYRVGRGGHIYLGKEDTSAAEASSLLKEEGETSAAEASSLLKEEGGQLCAESLPASQRMREREARS